MDKLYYESSLIDQEIWSLFFRQGKSYEQVGFEVGYGRTSVYNKTKRIKENLLTMVREVEKEVYNIEN
ncbi:hypothetical protein [Gemella cuniculi]|uniref:hypothetical protein n=1 Tax=Gemella cuniculi TaxID=150240 RepID=UPI0004141D80|nr:hypothetical protein [Gemella cuniculi]